MNHALSAPSATLRSPLIVVCLLATWLVWGSTFLAIKFALISFPPFFQGGTRCLVAGAVLMVWALCRGQKMPTPIQWRNAMIVGALMLGGNMGGAAYAEQTVASGLVVTFMAATPALISVASLPFGIRPSRLEVFGIAIGLVGVFLLSSGAGFAGSPGGLIAMAVAVLSWSIGSVLSQHVFPIASGSAGFASQLLCGGVGLAGLSMLTGERFHWPPQPLALAGWLYLVVFGSLIAFTAYMVLLTRTRPTLASSWNFVTPIIGMLLGTTLGGEAITLQEWIAVGIVVMGVTALVLGRGLRRSRGPRSATDRQATN